MLQTQHTPCGRRPGDQDVVGLCAWAGPTPRTRTRPPSGALSLWASMTNSTPKGCVSTSRCFLLQMSHMASYPHLPRGSHTGYWPLVSLELMLRNITVSAREHSHAQSSHPALQGTSSHDHPAPNDQEAVLLTSLSPLWDIHLSSWPSSCSPPDSPRADHCGSHPGLHSHHPSPSDTRGPPSSFFIPLGPISQQMPFRDPSPPASPQMLSILSNQNCPGWKGLGSPAPTCHHTQGNGGTVTKGPSLHSPSSLRNPDLLTDQFIYAHLRPPRLQEGEQQRSPLASRAYTTLLSTVGTHAANVTPASQVLFL